MDAETRKKVRPGCQYLQSLARNRSGNIFVMMAAFLIPMTFLAGSGLDIGRLYLVKVRLQQACDAGVLAGRKAMTATSGTSIDASGTTVASTRANELFTSNFHSGWMGTSSVSFTPNRTNANEVTATAAATVPMTITRLFNNSNAPMNVSCTARFDVGDTDVMFVLDTTGSMACTTANDTGNGCGASPVSYTRPDGTTGWHATEQSGSKISGLRSAVLSFYDTLLSHSSTATHIRYGFVTYTSTVNAGYLLPSGYLVDNWNYNTRQVVGDANNGSSSNTTYNNVSSSTCDGYVRRTPVTALTYNTNGTASVTTKVSFSGTSSTNGSCVIKSQPVRPNWSYGNFTLDTSQFKLGNTINDPSKITAAMSVWQGCATPPPALLLVRAVCPTISIPI
jgi:Flp pilus assembly protein TadG